MKMISLKKLRLKKAQIIFIAFCSLIGFVGGYFSLPRKECGQIYCETLSQKIDVGITELANAIISDEHLNQFAILMKDSKIDKETLRQSISLDMTKYHNFFTITFSFDNKEDAEKSVEVFSSYSVSYLNSKIGKLNKSLVVEKTSFYKTNSFKNSVLSALFFLAIAFGFSILSVLVFNGVIMRKRDKEGLNEIE